MILLRLPRRFYDDHEMRDLPTPSAVRKTKRHVFVLPDDPRLPELLSDALSYSDSGDFDPCYRGLCMSACATVAAIQDAQPSVE